MFKNIWLSFSKHLMLSTIWGIVDNITIREITLHNFILLALRLGERPETCNKS